MRYIFGGIIQQKIGDDSYIGGKGEGEIRNESWIFFEKMDRNSVI